MKKNIALVMLLIITVLLSGCGKAASSNETSQTVSKTESTSLASSLNSEMSGNEIWDVYEMDDGTVYIDCYNGSNPVVSVPSQINGVTVTGLTGNAFYCNTIVTEVTLPDTIETISSHAFYQCTNLRKVTFPDSITYIGEESFMFCENLENIILPKSLEEMHDNAFSACSKLKSVTFTGDKLLTIPDKCFGYSALETITIPASVTHIGNAFQYIETLKTAYIPASVTEMDASFFRSPNVVIYGEKGSYAETYANEDGFEFIAQ